MKQFEKYLIRATHMCEYKIGWPMHLPKNSQIFNQAVRLQSDWGYR